MYKYILFDFDGTLIDTNQLVITSLNKAAEKYLGRTLTEEELNSILGKYLDEQMRCLSSEHCNEMVLLYKEFYGANELTMTYEFKDIAIMLRELTELGCKLAIVSAKGRGGIERGLELFGLTKYFDVIVSAYDIENNKPHPEPAEKALKKLSATASEALFVGDSPYDILCGKNAGLKTVLVDWTIFPKDRLLELKPDYIITTPRELTEIVHNSKP